MKKTCLLGLSAIVASFAVFLACSDNGSSDVALVDAYSDLPAAKGKATSYKVEKPCSENPNPMSSLAKAGAENVKETIEFYVNEDGSAVASFDITTYCIFNTILYETRNDTLFVSADNLAPEPIGTYTDSLGRIVEVGAPHTKCVCRYGVEATVPPEFVGTRYVTDGAGTYAIIYKKK